MKEIRRAGIQDFLDIARLDREAWIENRHGGCIPDGEHVWRIWVEHALVFCSFEKKVVTGAIVAFATLDGSLCLHKVFVERLSRGQGAGTRLFKQLLIEVDRLKVEIFLTVDPENVSALALYAKFGFVKTRYVSGYYREAEDRLVLLRKVRESNVKI